MGAAETRKNELPDRWILTKKINASMILISNINKKIQNFISLSYSFEDEEQIDKTRNKIINEYKILRASKRKIKSACDILPRDDAEFTNLYLNYNNELTSLTQRYKSIIKGSLIGSRTLAMIWYNAASKVALNTYDLQAHKANSFPSELLQQGDCVIAVPNSRLFICSWGYTYVLEISKISDLSSCIKAKIPKKLNYLESAGVYYKNFVYIFGGFSSAKARRFDLKNNLWRRIASLPKYSMKCVCTGFKDSILICGMMHNKIYKYDLNTMSYSEINSMWIDGESYKILFKLGSRVYLFEKWYIFESELENEYIYNRIGRSKHKWWSISQVKYYDNCAYFISAGYRNFEIFKFDLSSKNLEKLL